MKQDSATFTSVNSIAQRLKEAREAAGLSQAQLAAAAGVSAGTIGNIEAGTRQRPQELLAIAAAVKVNAEWLKSGRGPRAAPDPGAPPAPPRDFNDSGRKMDDSDWGLLDAVRLVFTLEEQADIRARAKQFEERYAELRPDLARRGERAQPKKR